MQERNYFRILGFTLVFLVFILVWNIGRYSYLIGHDIYFHLHLAEVIKDHHFSIPETVPLYWDGIKFGYPPSFHILVNSISQLFKLNLSSVFQLSSIILPALALFMTYQLIRVNKNKKIAILSLTLLILLSTVMIPIYQGEYPRLLGYIFLTLGLISVDNQYRFKNTLLSGVLFSLAITTNLITALFTLGLLAYLTLTDYLQHQRFQLLSIIFLTIILSSWWWGRALGLYGADYFLQVLLTHQKTGRASIAGIVVGVIIIGWSIYQRKMPNIWTVWFFLAAVLIEPFYISVPLVLWLSQRMEKYINSNWKVISASILGLASFFFFTSGKVIYHDAFMNPDVLQATEWVKSNTHPEQNIMAFLDPQFTPFEWIKKTGEVKTSLNNRDVSLPPLTQRQVYSWMGYEWNNDPKQLEIFAAFHKNLCAASFLQNVKKYEIYPDLIWINKDSPDYYNPKIYCNDLQEPWFNLTFENKSVIIYRVNWQFIFNNLVRL